MRTDRNGTAEAREWLPPLMTAMVDAQFADPPADPGENAPAAWPRCNAYLFEASEASAVFAARTRRRTLVELLRSYLAGRRLRRQTTM